MAVFDGLRASLPRRDLLRGQTGLGAERRLPPILFGRAPNRVAVSDDFCLDETFCESRLVSVLERWYRRYISRSAKPTANDWMTDV